MSDDHLLLKLEPPEPKRTEASSRQQNNVLSIAALCVSAAAMLFSGLQWHENHLSRQEAWRPHIEVQDETFIGDYGIDVKYHNTGHSSAMRLASRIHLYKSVSFGHYEPVAFYTLDNSISHGGDIPSSDIGEIRFILPTPAELVTIGMDLQNDPVEFRGNIEYFGEDNERFNTPFCFGVDYPRRYAMICPTRNPPNAVDSSPGQSK